MSKIKKILEYGQDRELNRIRQALENCKDANIPLVEKVLICGELKVRLIAAQKYSRANKRKRIFNALFQEIQEIIDSSQDRYEAYSVNNQDESY